MRLANLSKSYALWYWYRSISTLRELKFPYFFYANPFWPISTKRGIFSPCMKKKGKKSLLVPKFPSFCKEILFWCNAILQPNSKIKITRPSLRGIEEQFFLVLRFPNLWRNELLCVKYLILHWLWKYLTTVNLCHWSDGWCIYWWWGWIVQFNGALKAKKLKGHWWSALSLSL